MRQNMKTRGSSSGKTVKDIHRATGKQISAKEKIRAVLDGLHGDKTIAELYRREPRNASVATRALDASRKIIFPARGKRTPGSTDITQLGPSKAGA